MITRAFEAVPGMSSQTSQPDRPNPLLLDPKLMLPREERPGTPRPTSDRPPRLVAGAHRRHANSIVDDLNRSDGRCLALGDRVMRPVEKPLKSVVGPLAGLGVAAQRLRTSPDAA
jgi:hypothetical protein